MGRYQRFGDSGAQRRVFLRGLASAGVALGTAACAPAVAPKPVLISAAAPESRAGDETEAQPTMGAQPTVQVETPREPAPPPRVPVYFRPEYTLASYSFDTTRKSAWLAQSIQSEALPNLELTAPGPLTETDVTVVHSQGYVDAVRTGQPRALAQSQGFTWDPGLYPMVLASNGGAVQAAKDALRVGVAGSLSSGLHHARQDHGNGNCTFNGLALAARAMLAHGVQRILILDLDAHCGGGTDELVGREPAVHITDVAVHPFDRYTARNGNTLDLVQQAGRYLATIQGRLDELASSDFDICLYNAGMDPHEGCPLGGLRGVTTEMLQQREQLVFEWCRAQGLPISFVLAGGYVGPNLDAAGLTALHRFTLDAAAQMPVQPV